MKTPDPKKVTSCYSFVFIHSIKELIFVIPFSGFVFLCFYPSIVLYERSIQEHCFPVQDLCKSACLDRADSIFVLIAGQNFL